MIAMIYAPDKTNYSTRVSKILRSYSFSNAEASEANARERGSLIKRKQGGEGSRERERENCRKPRDLKAPRP